MQQQLFLTPVASLGLLWRVSLRSTPPQSSGTFDSLQMLTCSRRTLEQIRSAGHPLCRCCLHRRGRPWRAKERERRFILPTRALNRLWQFSHSFISHLQVPLHPLIGDPEEGLTCPRVAEATRAHVNIVQVGHSVDLWVTKIISPPLHKHTIIRLLWNRSKFCFPHAPANSQLSVHLNPLGWSSGLRPVWLDCQTGLRCICEPLVSRCHGKDLTAACKCIVPGRTCAAGCCACPLKGKRNKRRLRAVVFNLRQIINNPHTHRDFAIKQQIEWIAMLWQQYLWFCKELQMRDLSQWCPRKRQCHLQIFIGERENIAFRIQMLTTVSSQRLSGVRWAVRMFYLSEIFAACT